MWNLGSARPLYREKKADCGVRRKENKKAKTLSRPAESGPRIGPEWAAPEIVKRVPKQ